MCRPKLLCLPPVANTLRDLDMRFTRVNFGSSNNKYVLRGHRLIATILKLNLLFNLDFILLGSFKERKLFPQKWVIKCAVISTFLLHDVFQLFTSREKLSSGVCEQQRCRPACPTVQSDKRLCYSLIAKYHIESSYEQNFNSLAILCSWAGWFESHFFWNPEDRFSRVEAHLW